MVRYSETRGQCERRELGARLDNTWPSTRPNRRPRGLKNPSAYCYRNSVLQMLAHLPKFVNWIDQHNEPGQDWPCHPNDPNQRLPDGQEKDKAVLDMDQKLILGCVPCRLKAFFQDYWGARTLNPKQNPAEFPATRPSILPLHRMGERWNCHLPPKERNKERLPGETDAQWIRRRLTRETAEERTRRVSKACDQQCADEYLGYLHGGITSSIDPANQRRLDEYAALFMLQRHQETRCEACNFARPGSDPTDYSVTCDTGFSLIRPLAISQGTDHLASALARSQWLAGKENDALVCPTANDSPCDPVNAVTTKEVEAAPEYLRVHLDLTTLDDNGAQTIIKNRNPVEIPDILDLTEHVHRPDANRSPRPLQYKLISVLYHAGPNTTGGHWAAGVSHPIPDTERKAWVKASKGKKRKYDETAPVTCYHYCSDSYITEWQTEGDENPLTVNPFMTKEKSEMDAVVLMYERIRQRQMVRELASNLSETYYNVNKKDQKDSDSGGKKRKETDDAEKKGLRRSKRLKAKK